MEEKKKLFIVYNDNDIYFRERWKFQEKIYAMLCKNELTTNHVQQVFRNLMKDLKYIINDINYI